MFRHAPYLLMLLSALAVTPALGQSVMLDDDGAAGLEANAAPPDDVTLTVEAVKVWQDMLTQHPAVLDAYADLLTRYCRDQLRQQVDLPYVEVTQREYYYACPPNESILEYARSQGGGGSLGEALRRWWTTYAAAPGEAQQNADASGLVAVLPPEERARMWRMPGTGGTPAIGLLPCMLQPADESPEQSAPPAAETPPDDGMVPWNQVPQTTTPDTGYVDTTPYVDSYDRAYGTYPYSSGSYNVYYGGSTYYSPYSYGYPVYAGGLYGYPYNGVSIYYGNHHDRHRYWTNYGAPYGGPYWHNYGAPYGEHRGRSGDRSYGGIHRSPSDHRPGIALRRPTVNVSPRQPARGPSRGSPSFQPGNRGTGQRGGIRPPGNTIRRDTSPRVRQGTRSSPPRSNDAIRPSRPSRNSGNTPSVRPGQSRPAQRSPAMRPGNTGRSSGSANRPPSRPSSPPRQSQSRGGHRP